ncbi:MAG: DHH family phosphoesterase [Candidatus Nanoarchaeia archaeon]
MNYKSFDELTQDDVSNTYTSIGRIETVKQTSGPTLMVLMDASQSFTFKAFIKPGERAYPECDIGDVVEVKYQVQHRQGAIEGEVKEMKKVAPEKIKEFEELIERKEEERFKAVDVGFSIQSEVLEALKPRMLQVATIIKKAIAQRRPIILRHDADCDGYSSAICLERAILKFMDECSGGDVNLRYMNFKRAPSRAPFYEYEDAVKDISFMLKDMVKNGAKEPLVIITDNGSTSEDIFAYKQMKLYNCPLVVIDHHYPGEKDEKGKVAVDYYIDGHINPYLEGFDSNVCSGMLGYELARFIYEENTNSVMIPAMAGLLDHVEGHELNTYVELAQKSGYSVEFMQKLGDLIYLQSHYMRFGEAREFFDDIFGNNTQVQQEIVNFVYPEIEKLYEKTRRIGKTYSTVEDFGPFYVVQFDGEKGTARGQYPAVGKSTNLIHAMFEEELDKPVVTMTSGSTFLTIRVGDDVKEFSIPQFCTDILEEELKHTGAEGGGHEHAGSVKFVEYAREEVIGAFLKYLKKSAEQQ